MMKLSAQEMLNKFSKTASHAVAVKNFCLKIFDETNEKICQMPQRHRLYLEAAALLHDIGYHIDTKGHNKHSMNMIIEHGLNGFTSHEEKIIGCICRYHRGSLPDKEEHEVYNTFEKKDRKIIKRLAGILKISDGLDRGHYNLIKDVMINYDESNNIVEFLLTPTTPEFHPDITCAVRKRDLYEIGFKCQSIIKFV